MFKNMKIEINDQQPLDEVVRELERLGYKHTGWADATLLKHFIAEIHTIGRGDFEYTTYKTLGFGDLTTLSELKNME